MQNQPILRDLYVRVIVERMKMEEMGGTRFTDAAKELGIDVKDYSPERDWPVLSARKAKDFAERFVAEIERLTDAGKNQ